jgi:hypothetical protein
VGVINEVGATQELQLALALGHHGMSLLRVDVAGTGPHCKRFYTF